MQPDWALRALWGSDSFWNTSGQVLSEAELKGILPGVCNALWHQSCQGKGEQRIIATDLLVAENFTLLGQSQFPQSTASDPGIESPSQGTVGWGTIFGQVTFK